MTERTVCSRAALSPPGGTQDRVHRSWGGRLRGLGVWRVKTQGSRARPAWAPFTAGCVTLRMVTRGDAELASAEREGTHTHTDYHYICTTDNSFQFNFIPLISTLTPASSLSLSVSLSLYHNAFISLSLPLSLSMSLYLSQGLSVSPSLGGRADMFGVRVVLSHTGRERDHV